MDPHSPRLAGDRDDTISAPEIEALRSLPRGDHGPQRIAAGTLVGRYLIVSRVDEGGMGVVYAAYDPELDRKLALKLLRPGASGRSGSEGQRRLLREARAMAKLSHPNVIAIHDVGLHEESVFLAMELVDGGTLTAWLAQTPRRWQEVLDVLVPAGEGLAAAHAAAMVHRDFKPDNVMLDADGRVRVMDFGLARMGDAVSDRPVDAPESSLESGTMPTYALGLTRAGAVMGTPAYMAPEQYLGLEADARSDQFSYCVTLYEALYRQRPFEADSLAALALAVTEGQVREPPPGHGVPLQLRRLVLRGLQADPAERHESMKAVLAALARARDSSRRRARVLTAGGALLVLAVGGGVLAAREREDPCAGASERLAGVWDDGVRATVTAALRATGLAYAEDTLVRVQARLDEYRDAWAEQHRSACEATAVRHEQSPELLDLRMACLERRKNALRAATAVLAEADRDVTANAVQIVANLEPLDACSDSDALLAAVPPPASAQARREVEAAHEELARVVALRYAGKYAEALALAQTVRDSSGALQYRPLDAEVAAGLGEVLHRMGKRQRAEAEQKNAVFAARASRHDVASLRATLGLVEVIGSDPSRLDEALLWAEIARAEIARGGDDPAAAGSLADHVGNALGLQGRHQEAADRHREAAALLVDALGERDPRVAGALNNLGSALYALGDYPGAGEHFGRALAIWRDNYGDRHPSTATALSNLAMVARLQGDYAAAAKYYVDALTIKRAALGDRHPSVAASLKGLASVLSRNGKHAEALAHAQEALAIQRANDGDGAVATAHTRNQIGVMLRRLGRVDEAIAMHEQALAIATAASGADSEETADSHDDLGLALTGAGRYSAAVEHHRAALAIRTVVKGGDHPTTAYSLVGLGEALLAGGEVADATAVLERAYRLRAAGAEPVAQAEAGSLLARALMLDPEFRARAQTLGRAARSAFASTPGHEDEVRQLDAWLDP